MTEPLATDLGGQTGAERYFAEQMVDPVYRAAYEAERSNMRELTEQEQAFVVEYRSLCEKHGLIVMYDGGYQASEVGPLEPEWVDWDVFRRAHR